MTDTHSQTEIRRKAARNRLMLDQYREGRSYAAVGRLHGLTSGRAKIVILNELARVEREAELAVADTMRIQPHPIHMPPATRRMVASVLGFEDFTWAEVRAAEVAILREPGFSGPHWRELRAWLDRKRPISDRDSK